MANMHSDIEQYWPMGRATSAQYRPPLPRVHELRLHDRLFLRRLLRERWQTELRPLRIASWSSRDDGRLEPSAAAVSAGQRGEQERLGWAQTEKNED